MTSETVNSDKLWQQANMLALLTIAYNLAKGAISQPHTEMMPNFT